MRLILFPPDIALITMIGIDHTEWLGDTRELIGFEKAGIMRTWKTSCLFRQDGH